MKTTREIADAAIADARAYVGRKNSANLDAFEAFVVAVTGAKRTPDFLAGVRAAGLYSRYQTAKREGYLPAILAPKPKATRKPKATPEPTPES